MVEGSPETPIEEQDPEVLAEAIVEIARQRAAESSSDEGGQAGATDTTTPPEEEAKPEPPTEPEEAPSDAGKPPTEPGIDLSHLPGGLQETARGQPVEVQRQIDKLWRSMQSTVDKERDTYRDQKKALASVAEDGEHFRRISQHPEARELLFKALDRVSGESEPDAKDRDAAVPEFLATFGKYLEMEEDEQRAFSKNLRSMIREEALRVADERVRESVHAPVERAAAITSTARDVAEANGLDPEKATSAWQGFLRAVGEQNVTPENVAVLFTPYAQNAALQAKIEALSAKPPSAAPETAKPKPAGGARAASLDAPSSTIDTEWVPAYEREGRNGTPEERAAAVWRRLGTTRTDLAREMEEGRFYNS